MNPYEILGVASDATEEEIKQAFRRVSMRHHPDREGGDEALFRQATLARDVLLDPARRAQYDRGDGISSAAHRLDEKARKLISDGLRSELAIGREDPIETVLTQFGRMKEQAQVTLAGLPSKIVKHERMLARCRVSGGENYLKPIIGAAIDDIREQQGHLADQIAVIDRAVELLSTHEMEEENYGHHGTVFTGGTRFNFGLPWHG